MTDTLLQSCEILNGVGPSLAGKLAKCGIFSLQDLLFHLPYRYQDRTRVTPLIQLGEKQWAVVEGTILHSEVTRGPRRSFIATLEDPSALIKLRFFNFNASFRNTLTVGTKIRCFGEARTFSGTKMMVHPEFSIINEENTPQVEEALTPIYSTTSGLSQSRLRQVIGLAIDMLKQTALITELLPESLSEKSQFPQLKTALIFLHNPPPDTLIQQLEEGKHPAQKRLAFEELLAHHMSMRRLRLQAHTHQSTPCIKNTKAQTTLRKQLPFELTSAQHRVLEDINTDLEKATPMHRLVQGDVGSGKTIVAALSALKVIANNMQVAMMAPTELLAEQHYINFCTWFEPLGFKVSCLLGKHGVKHRRHVLADLQEHQIHIVIGTHALFQQSVEFDRLGLIIIDEQHRFGVEQRLKLQEKGRQDDLWPHQLVMTATPIPRTLAMTAYADLDCSIIDELPPGRTAIKTAVVNGQKREQIIQRLQEAFDEGKQAYWVCTLIEESENLQCQAAEDTTIWLRETLPDHQVGLVHGRMKGTEKQAVMNEFKAGKYQLLVATTVIEVGVDIPNATVMIIENSERLGLSQLHQLRGRVGRGSLQSHCILLYQAPLSHHARDRLQVMRDSTDGFVIAEKDLHQRGAGEILGTKQTGLAHMKIACLKRDGAMMPKVSQVAQTLYHDSALIEALIKRWLGEGERYSHS